MTTPQQQRHVDLPPPPTSTGVWAGCARTFSLPLNGALTLLALYVLYRVVPPLVEWALIRADWAGLPQRGLLQGRCVLGFHSRASQPVHVRFYPVDQQWRVNLAVALLGALIVPLCFKRFALKRWLVPVSPFLFIRSSRSIFWSAAGSAWAKSRRANGEDCC